MSDNDVDRSKTPRHFNQGRHQIWVFGMIAFLIILLGLGLILSTWPLEHSDLVNLGAGLMTGGLVGIALTALEYALERRRTEQEKNAAEQQRGDLIKYARGLLTRLIVRHAQELYVNLFISPEQDSRLEPVVKLGEEEISRREIIRGIQWVADKHATDADWHEDQHTVESVDALLQLGTHLAEIENLQLKGSAGWHVLRFHTMETADRLAKTADYLSQGGDPNTAQIIADVASNLRGAAVTSLPLREFLGEYEMQLPPWEDYQSEDDSQGIEYISIGDDLNPGTSFIRESVGYLTDKLRKGFDDSLDDKSSKSSPDANTRRIIDISLTDDQIVQLRWKRLLSDSHSEALWENRFVDNSWLRTALNDASSWVQWSYGLSSTPPRVGNFRG